MSRELNTAGTLIVVAAMSAATLLTSCSSTAKAPVTSTSTDSHAAPSAPAQTAAPKPKQTSTPPSRPTVDIATATCGSFEAMNNADRFALAAQFRDAHANSIGNPMYSELDPSGKASYLAMTLDAYCSQPGRSTVRVASLTF